MIDCSMKIYKGMSTSSAEYKKIEKEVLENLWKALDPVQLELEIGIFNMRGE